MKQYLLAGLLAVLFVPTTASANGGIWISDAEIAARPMSGKAWDSLKKAADTTTGSPNIADQEDDTDVRVLAKALVYARTHTAKYRTDVINACMAAVDTELGGRTLALGRQLVSYVIAADLVGLPPAQDAVFRAWLERARDEDLDGKTL